MATFTMGNGKTTRLMVLELILILMERVTKVNGLKINNMVKVMKHGLMEPVTEVCILKEKNTEKAYILGQVFYIYNCINR